MKKTSVLIVGGGPLGMTASALLSQYGVDSIMVDMRPDLDNHPRARFYDSCTLELFRQLGCAQEIEATGLGAAWTQYNPVFMTLNEGPIAKVYSREFYSVDRKITPQRPVMTSQDLIEPILLSTAKKSDIAQHYFSSEVFDLSQDENGCYAQVRNLETGEVEEIQADYVIGADGSRSYVREVIGGVMEGEWRDIWFRDVLFHGDLSPYVREHVGGLLFVWNETASALYQPLDGKNRWRCQIPSLVKDDDVSEEKAIAWIRKTAGAGEDLKIEVESLLQWRVTAQVCNTFGEGRMYLLGDAAHIFTPTGGTGMNTSWAGALNFLWKLAYVIKGISPASILSTYKDEWHSQAYRRTREAMNNAASVRQMYLSYIEHGPGEEFIAACNNFYQYAGYTGLIFGYEIYSDLIQQVPDYPLITGDDKQMHVPVVQPGRRLPHIWLDEPNDQSIYDWFGFDYVVALGEGADHDEWSAAVAEMQERGFPVRVEKLPEQIFTPFEHEQVVLVRPDRIVAAHWLDVNEPAIDLLEKYLPLAAS